MLSRCHLERKNNFYKHKKFVKFKKIEIDKILA